jgi:RNA recognition motif-containing protein
MHSEPSPRTPRVFASNHLDAASLETLNQLEKALIENPFDYYSHVNFITILHQGLQNVLHATDASPAAAQSYDLLPHLRQAYEAMDSKYALGEHLWDFRINDEKALAQTIEQRTDVLELCQKATREEPYSAKLWALYGDYIAHLISCVWDPNSPERWSEEEKAIGREVFTPDLLMDALQRGADYVKHDVSETSSLVWDRYLQALVDDLQRQFSQEKAKRVATIFNDRLSQPHATWDSTLGKYSTFNSQFNQNNYEAIMEYAVSQHARVKEIYNHRQEHEFNLLKAMQSGDQAAEHYALTRYLKWEKKTSGVSSFHLINGLYERATVRFPVDPSLWEDHVEFLIWQNNRSVSILDVLERATRHCPWSGNLWSHRILTQESEGKPHSEIEHVKHSATRTGMLEHTDIEELMKVQIAWCGYLRRKAFDDAKATEDDADIAEIGIRSALELAHETGIKKYGKNWAGDPKYRLERIHIKFWMQRGNMDEARHIWESLVKRQQDSYDFWYRYYIFEMVVWAKHSVRDHSNAGHQLLPPSKATAVLEKGLKRINSLDYPEPLVEMYVNHCEQHESVLKVRSANIERRRLETLLSIRRAKDQAIAEAAAAQYTTQAADGTGKRKREDGAELDDTAAKKSKAAEVDGSTAGATADVPARLASEAPSASATTQKRDREHTSIIVRNLPSDVTQTRIRKFFTDAGTVRDVIIKPEGENATAHVEFEAPEEAEYALSKAAKGFEGRDITIKLGGSTTLYVTNYPPHADEAYLRKLFSPFGDILDVRLPSLKYNTHRRFCYIQFTSAEAARAATKLDGTDVEGFTLLAKLSNPDAKKDRSGATEESREVYVRHINFSATKADIEKEFSQCGTIENIRMPKYTTGKFAGNNRGYGYIAYKSKEEAEKAVAELNGKNFMGVDLIVVIAKPQGEAKPKIKSEIVNTATPEPSAPGSDRRASAGDSKQDTSDKMEEDAKPTTSAPSIAPVADRTIALLNIPDTVKDARIKALVEPYAYKKITLMPQHGGAIVEFHDVSSVGKASLALDGHEIAPGKNIRVGTVAELKKEKAEFRPGTSFMKPVHVSRPAAPRGRGGGMLRGRGKPGLGMARHGLGTAGSGSSAGAEGEKTAPKSNDEFRAMLLGGKKAEAAPAAPADPDTPMNDGDGDASAAGA